MLPIPTIRATVCIMATPSHNICPNNLPMPSNDDTWDSSYPEVAWTNTPPYPTPGMAVGPHWIHQASRSNSSSDKHPIPASPCSNPTITPPSSYHQNCIPWPVGSPNGYIVPDAHNTACHSNPPPLSTPMARMSSFHSSPDESSDSPNCDTYVHGMGAHSRQASGIEYVFAFILS